MNQQESPLEIVLMSEKKDDEQIIAEMRGELVASYVYQFQGRDGKTITGLSYAGIKEAVRRRGNMSIYPCDCCHKPAHIDETDEEYKALVTAWDLQNNVKMVGAGSSRKNQPFAFVLAVNKAHRNALRKLLPEKAIALLIEQYLRKEQPKPVQPPPEQKTVLPKVGLGPQRLD